MSDISTVYKELLESDDGDIIVKLKDGKQLKVISFLIKKRSPVFKTMLESSMQEATRGVVDLSSQYSFEAFREFMAYIYYNKLYTGSYVPLLFEILCIADYYAVDSCRSYFSDRIVKLITNVPVCLTIASEALKHGTLANEIYANCLRFLLETIQPQRRVCYDQHSGDSRAWCCSTHSTKQKVISQPILYAVNGQVACIYSTIRRSAGHDAGQITGYTERCCMHASKLPLNISELPDFIVDDVNSFMIGT
ncbi:hypothetical protein EDD21DRAFT_10068 [Dissophora ornata]|nr:hypothetical protein BGZ58_002760 [Dissophora ornata]KAI8603832.1 hypothetical protein EDD21DRAFT_10068 [Dissophora ornata]